MAQSEIFHLSQGPSQSAATSPPSRNFAGEFAKFACASDTDSADSDDEGGREFKRRQEELKREQKKGGKGEFWRSEAIIRYCDPLWYSCGVVLVGCTVDTGCETSYFLGYVV